MRDKVLARVKTVALAQAVVEVVKAERRQKLPTQLATTAMYRACVR